MVTEHAFSQLRIERCQRSEDRGAASRVGCDGASLRRREVRVLVDNVEQRLVNLADVMKERDALDDLSLVFVELRRVREHERICCNSANVSTRVCVVRVDGIE